MRFLTPEHWAQFQHPDGRFDGVKFEKLIAKLLPNLYPGEWIPTKYSWDGKKDFYQQRGDERRWAECKAYKEPISINVVSPTLIMALLDNARVVLLFSYSRLNRNARMYLSQFGALTGRTVRVFDDEILEDLILTHEELKKYFPNLSRVDLPPLVRIRSVARISQDPDVEYQAKGIEDSDEQDIYLTLLSTFCVDVLVQNHSINSGPIKGTINLDASDIIDRFWLFNEDISLDNPSIDFRLESGESCFKRFYLRARRTGKLAPPTIRVTVDGCEPEVLTLDPLEISSILAVPLTGKTQNDALAQFRHRVSAKDKPFFCHIHGNSGTGKSRLVREFRDELLGRGYLTFVFNAEDERNSSFDHFIKRLIATICKLPMLEHVVKPTESSFGLEGEPSGQALLDLLYCDTVRPSSDLEATINTVVELLSSRKVAVVIDNIQFLDAPTISLVNSVITKTAGTATRNVWVLCLNTEVITPEMPAANLSGRLRSLAAEAPNDAQVIGLEGFTIEDACLYLDQALAGEPQSGEHFSLTYPQTTSLILERVGTRPLYLEQSLQHAADRGGLGWRAGRLRVIDIDKFHAAISELPARIQQLIAKRWDFVSQRIPTGSVLLVQALAELISVPLQIVLNLGILRSEIHVLTNLGIVDISESNEVTFHHQQHYLFFAELYRNITLQLARDVLAAIEGNGQSTQYPFQIVTLRETLGELTDTDLSTIAAVVVNKTNMGIARRRATPLLLELFNRPDISVDAGTELRVVDTLCQEVKRHVAFRSASDAFASAYSIRQSRIARYLAFGEDYYHFIYDYSNSFFALHRDGDALPLLQSALDKLDDFQFQSKETKLLARGQLLNRLGVALKTIQDISAAAEVIQESLAIAQALSDTRLVYKNYIDWGYLYHGFFRTNDELIRLWRRAMTVYEENQATGAHMLKERASYLLHNAELLLLAQHREAAIQTIDEGIRFSRRTLTPFHEVKLLLLRVVAELAWGNVVKPGSLTSWLNEAEDRAVTTHANRSFWVVFYTRAKLDWMAKDYDGSIRHLLLALEQIAKILTDPRMEERHEPFFEDLAIHFRKARYRPSESEIRLIKNSRIRESVLAITGMEQPSFDELLDRYIPSATFHDGRYNLPVP
jgi:tetratricopeptide (TPR) repeat protein